MKKYYILFILCIATTPVFCQAPNWNWAVMPDSIDCFATATDHSGNLYVAGGYMHYLIKYDASGNLIWTKTAGNSLCTAEAICVDNAGNILVTGDFSTYGSLDTLSFDTIALQSLNNSRDMFTVKLDSSGNVKWAKKAGGPYDDYWSTGISTDGAGNVYVTTGANASFIFGNDTLTTATSYPSFTLLKYDPNGDEQWGKIAVYPGAIGSTSPGADDICTDASGNSYITGSFLADTIDFGGITLSNTTSTGAYNDYFIAKFDSSGNAIWAKGATGLFGKYGHAVRMDNSGYVYAIGNIEESSVFDTITLPYPGRCFIVKYDTSGNVVWAKNFGDYYWDGAWYAAVDGNGNIFIAGTFYDQAFLFGNSILHNIDQTLTNYDIFVVKFDSLGNELWAKSAGSDTCDDVFGIAVDANSNAYIVGRFHSLQFSFDGIILGDTNSTWWCCSPFIARLDHCNAYYNLYADTVPHNWIAVNQATGIAPMTYLWDWGDGTFSSGATPSHIYNVPGYYNICLTITDGAGCTNTYCDSSTYLNRNNGNTMVTVNVINQTTHHAELSNEENVLNIFPNPATSTIQLTIATKQNTPLRCEIINVLGEKVFQSTIINHQSPINLNLSFLAKGIYLVMVSDGKSFENKKLVIE